MIAARRESRSPQYLLFFFFPSLRAPGDLRRHISDGGSVDPEKNVALFNTIKKARVGGVPKANIESALQKVRNFYFILILTGDVDII
jgi:hypothetical protein